MNSLDQTSQYGLDRKFSPLIVAPIHKGRYEI